jgi:hypothetical protein
VALALVNFFSFLSYRHLLLVSVSYTIYFTLSHREGHEQIGPFKEQGNWDRLLSLFGNSFLFN